jgi:hypothetical protein
MSIVLVECVSMFRMRYAVETPDDHPEYALDSVVCDELEEMSQEHLGETIVSYRAVSKEEYLKIYDTDNEYAKSWTDEQKMKYIHKIPDAA